MTETTLNAEEITEITEITEVVTASEALKPTEKIKKPPSQAKLDALERARLARSQKAKEKRETLLKAALIVDKAAQSAPSEPPPRTSPRQQWLVIFLRWRFHPALKLFPYHPPPSASAGQLWSHSWRT